MSFLSVLFLTLFPTIHKSLWCWQHVFKSAGMIEYYGQLDDNSNWIIPLPSLLYCGCVALFASSISPLMLSTECQKYWNNWIIIKLDNSPFMSVVLWVCWFIRLINISQAFDVVNTGGRPVAAAFDIFCIGTIFVVESHSYSWPCSLLHLSLRLSRLWGGHWDRLILSIASDWYWNCKVDSRRIDKHH